MFSYRLWTSGKRTLMAGLAITAFAGAGVAGAAATGNAPWQDHTPEVSTATTEPAVTDAPTTVPEITTPAVTVQTEGTGGTGSTGNDTTNHEPASTEPASTEPPTVPPSSDAPATTTPAPKATTSDGRPDTYVPLGIDLACTVQDPTAQVSAVECTWNGAVVDGFAKFLLLRGNGGAKGRVPFMSSDPAANACIDASVPAGSYSYVVVEIDANGKTLVHSNPVFVQIGAAG